MKLLVAVLIIVVLIFTSAAFMFYHTAALADNLLEGLFVLEQDVKQEKWGEAAEEVTGLKKLWKKADSWWTPVMDHRETELLDISLVRVARWVEVGSRENALVEISVAKRMVQGIQEKERPNIRNIF